jgi:hypothetical protein
MKLLRKLFCLWAHMDPDFSVAVVYVDRTHYRIDHQIHWSPCHQLIVNAQSVAVLEWIYNDPRNNVVNILPAVPLLIGSTCLRKELDVAFAGDSIVAVHEGENLKLVGVRTREFNGPG